MNFNSGFSYNGNQGSGENRSRNLNDHKRKIMEFMALKGPSLPIHISSYLKIDTLLSGAFLSDLLSDKELKISNMRVGNSPVYFIPGQESQLEKFANYLGGKEKEAFYLLKEHKVLDDILILPAIRVALRSIKDFSFPFEHNGKLYWKYLGLNDNGTKEIIECGGARFSQLPQGYQKVNTQNSQSINQPIQQVQQMPVEQPKIELGNDTNSALTEDRKEIILLNEIKKIEPIFESPINQVNNEIATVKEEIPIVKEIIPRKPRVVKDSEFNIKVKEFLNKEGIELVNVVKKGKKEFIGLVKVSNNDIKTEYLCIAKEKRSISDKELMKQLQIGQRKNLPVIFVTSGEASKKAVEWLDYLGNLIIYKKMGD
ncbi:MAG: hypothetical protein AABX03_03580 [Nanoarchaeota archaeon]